MFLWSNIVAVDYRDELEPQKVVETESASPAPVQEDVEPVQSVSIQESAPPPQAEGMSLQDRSKDQW